MSLLGSDLRMLLHFICPWQPLNNREGQQVYQALAIMSDNMSCLCR